MEALKKQYCNILQIGIIVGLSILYFISFTLMNYAKFYQQYELVLFGVMLIFISSLVYCCLALKKRMVMLMFFGVILLFLLSRPLISWVWGLDWSTFYSVESNMTTLYIIAISMVSIIVGSFIHDIWICVHPISSKEYEKKDKVLFKITFDTFKRATFIILCGCMFLYFVREIETFILMRGKAYSDLFVIEGSILPGIIVKFANLMPYILCLYLAMMPKKKTVIILLGLYVASAVPLLLIGGRSAIILNFLFAIVYYFIRDVVDKKPDKKWLGKIEKTLIIITLPLFIIFAGAYNYIRDGKSVNLSVVDLGMDFAYKQGTTYDTVLQGLHFKDQLIGKEKGGYTFYDFTKLIMQDNIIAQKVFKQEASVGGNSLRKVYLENSLSHDISYAAMGKDYLAGHGRGSSYIIENYLDFGYIGTIVYSGVLGFLLMFAISGFKKNWFLSTIILSSLLTIFFLPRDHSLSFISFFYSYTFWLGLMGTVVFAKILEVLFDKGYLKWLKSI